MMKGVELSLGMVVLLAMAAGAAAQNVSGSYSLKTPEGNVQMALQENEGSVKGSVAMEDGSMVTLEGSRKGAEILGVASIGGKQVLFKLRPQSGQLVFTLIPVNQDNQPDLANSQEFSFSKQGGGSVQQRAQSAQPAPQDDPSEPDEEDGEEADAEETKQAPAKRPIAAGGASGASPRNSIPKRQPAANAPGSAPKDSGFRGGEVNDPSLGVRFTAPQGWKHQKRGSFYMMGHDSIPGMILILPQRLRII